MTVLPICGANSWTEMSAFGRGKHLSSRTDPFPKSMDVTFGEDPCRVRLGHTAENFSWLWRIALNLLKHETTAKQGIKGKRLKAGRDESYLRKVLGI